MVHISCCTGALIIMIIGGCLDAASAQSYSETMSLFGDKLNSSNYDPQIRPLRNQSQVLYVGVRFEVVSIVAIDDVAQSFTANGFIMFVWDDEILTWDPAGYGGITTIHPLPENIWRPRVVLVNTLGDRDLFADNKAPVFITYHGQVTWVPGSLFPISCQLDVTNFPFDEQTCTINLVAMTLATSELQFLTFTSEIQRNYFIINGEWDLTAATINTTTLNTSGLLLSAINLAFTMKRRSTFLIINVVLPVVFLSFLNIMVFVIPADSGEKISYGITVLLALSVFLTTVSSMLPESSLNLPMLTIYLFILLIISMLTVIDSIIIVFLANMEDKETRQRKVRDTLTNAVAKASLFQRVLTTFSKVSNNKVESSEPLENHSNKEDQVQDPVPSDPPVDGQDPREKDLHKDRPPVNRYKIIGKHIDKISFVVFLTIWLAVTLGFIMSIYLNG